MKDDVAKALNGVLVLQQWQYQLVQSALRQLGTQSQKHSSSSRPGESRRRGKPGKRPKAR
jgi:hypothetical protein